MLHPSPPRAPAFLAGVILSACLCAAARADGPDAADAGADAARARLFVAYGIGAADPARGVGGIRAASVQGLQWRDTVLYNALQWQAFASSGAVRGDTALVAPAPWQRTWLTVGDRRRDAALLLPVRLAGIDVHSNASAPTAPRPATLGPDVASAGEVALHGDAIEIRSLAAASLVTRIADAEDPPSAWGAWPGAAGGTVPPRVPAKLAPIPEHVVDAIEAARPLPRGTDGPLELRARYRAMPADAASAPEGPSDASTPMRDLSTRVAYTLDDSRVLWLEGRYAAFAQRAPQASMLLAYSLARTRLVDLQGRLGYVATGDAPGGPDSWNAALSLRIALDGPRSANPGVRAPPAFETQRCQAR